MKASVVLASTSVIRRELLVRAGLAVTVEPPQTDERAIAAAAGAVAPEKLAAVLAEAKAVSVSNRIGNEIVLGADQVLSAGNRLLNKPMTISEAEEQLRMLRGQSHRLESAVCCARSGRPIWSYVARAELVMRDFSNQFLRSYLASAGNDVLTSVGGYKLEGQGIQLFSEIRGDYFTILGLPMLPLLDFLRRDGVMPS